MSLLESLGWGGGFEKQVLFTWSQFEENKGLQRRHILIESNLYQCFQVLYIHLNGVYEVTIWVLQSNSHDICFATGPVLLFSFQYNNSTLTSLVWSELHYQLNVMIRLILLFQHPLNDMG
jgi:hypothetical protein